MTAFSVILKALYLCEHMAGKTGYADKLHRVCVGNERASVFEYSFEIYQVFDHKSTTVSTNLVDWSVLLATPYSAKVNADNRNPFIKRRSDEFIRKLGMSRKISFVAISDFFTESTVKCDEHILRRQ